MVQVVRAVRCLCVCYSSGSEWSGPVGPSLAPRGDLRRLRQELRQQGQLGQTCHPAGPAGQAA